MKKIALIVSVCSLSTLIVGCGSNTSKDPLDRFQAAALLENCISNAKGVQKNPHFSAAMITIHGPTSADIANLSEGIEKDIGADSGKLSNYIEFLDNSPVFKIAMVDLKQQKDSFSCHYAYFESDKGKLKKHPYLISIHDTKNPSTQVRVRQYVEALDLKEYVFDYFTDKSGLSYRKLPTKNSFNLDSNSDNLVSLKKSMNAKHYASDKFTTLVSLPPEQQFTSAYELALNATKDLYLPDYTPENPIYVTPVINMRQVKMLGNFEAGDRAIKAMDKFNEDRYVDPDTGIATYSDVLRQIKNEYGVHEGEDIAFEDKKGKVVGSIADAPSTLQLKGDEYFESGKSNELKMGDQ